MTGNMELEALGIESFHIHTCTQCSLEYSS